MSDKRSESLTPYPALLNEANEYYHSLLQAPECSPGALRDFLQSLLDARVSYGGRTLCPFLRPKFISSAWHRKIVEVCSILRGAIIKVKDALLEDRALFDLLGLSEGERRLAAIHPGFRSIGVTTRLDSFLAGDSLKFVELNAECPAGVAFSDTMQDLFLAFGPFRRFQERYRVRGFDTRKILLSHLLETYREWGGQGTPRIAIIDWREVSTYNEFELSADFFRKEGVPTQVGDPRDLDFVKGRLTLRGEPIDLVYRRVLTSDVLARPEETRALVSAYEAGAVCVVNSFRATLLHKKMLFSLLHHEKIRRTYTAEEEAVVREHIPFTCKVEEGFFKDPAGKKVDLIPWIAENRERLVLKPNDEYGGKGVIVGHTVSQDEWEEGLRQALVRPFVVQEKVDLPTEEFPLLGEEGVVFEPRYVDLDPYLFRGQCGGILTRLSATSLCNVTAGGGSVPTFVIEPLGGIS